MWTCKHCKESFDFTQTSEKANHSRWCDHNPNRKKLQKASAEGARRWYDEQLGPYTDFDVECQTCRNNFTVNERLKQFPTKEAYYCSRSCANSVGGTVKALKYHPDEEAHYTTVAWRYHEKRCCVKGCGEDRIVEVHHYNENHEDNRPENLVPICPTHHRYIHSRYCHLVQNDVDLYVKKFIGRVA